MGSIKFKVTEDNIRHLQRVHDACEKFKEYCYTRKVEVRGIFGGVVIYKELHSSTPRFFADAVGSYEEGGEHLYFLLKPAYLTEAEVTLDDLTLIMTYTECLEGTYCKELVDYVESLKEPLPEEYIPLPLPDKAVKESEARSKPWYKFW